MACFACGSGDPADRRTISSDLAIDFCRACGSGRAASPPGPDAYAELYGSDYYEAWGLHEPENRAETLKRTMFARRLDRCSSSMPRQGRVLDLGCATGFFLREAQSRGYQAFGVDVSEHAIRQCAAHVDPDRLHRGEFDGSVFAGERDFAAIFMSDYLEHVLDPAAVVARARERLAPRGTVVITTPDVGSLSRRVMGRRWPHFKPEHVSYFSRRGLERLLLSAGLELVDLRPDRKALSLAYASAHFVRYPNPWLTGWMKLLRRMLPESLANAVVWVPTGEVTAIATRPA